jgi:amidase
MHPLTEWVISPPYVKNHDAAEIWKVRGSAIYRHCTHVDQLRDRRDIYRREYSDHWWSQNVDVVVCAPFQGTASRHDTAKYWGCVTVYLKTPGNLTAHILAIRPSGIC